jgi:hypothetical protein
MQVFTYMSWTWESRNRKLTRLQATDDDQKILWL